MEPEIFPPEFFWHRISDKWLVSRTASICFAVAAIYIIAITAVLYSPVLQEDHPHPPFLFVLLCGIGGVLGALSAFFLWGGMWRYWRRCDPSKQIAHRIWFLVLFLGFCYGSILYYAVVYLPTTRKRRLVLS